MKIRDTGLFEANFLPEITQTEASECGLACLTMISRFYGHDVDLRSMRSRFPVSLKGMTVDSLISVAEKLDLGGRALKLDPSKLKNLSLPAILHWDLNHFVVLKKIKKNKIVIHDPARGSVALSLDEFTKHFTGIALELAPTANFFKQKHRTKVKFSSLWDRLFGLKKAIFQTFTLSLLLQVLVIASPFYLQLTVDQAILNFDLDFLFVLALAFGFLMLYRSTVSAMRSWTVLYFGNQAGYQLVANIFKHLMFLPLSFFEKRHVGDILSRMGSANPIQNALTQSIVSAILDGLMAIITAIVLFLYDESLGAIVLVSMVVLLFLNIIFYPSIRKKQEEVIICEAKKESFEIESIRAIATIKLHENQSQRLSKWRNLFVADINAAVSMNKYQIILTLLSDLTTGFQNILVVYFAAKLVINGGAEFTVGMMFAFMMYRQHFTDSILSLMEKVMEFRLLTLHLERIAEITETPIEDKPQQSNDILCEEKDAPLIQFKDVYFRFADNDPWVLCGINLTVRKGDFVVFSGDSGGGKTTLLKLLTGLYKPTSGEIYFNGNLLTEDSLSALRQTLGIVMQDDQLLSGTIADNISFFDSNIDMAKVYAAARFSCVHDVISSMPMKYLSFIGDMGSMLSAGQKQRVLLARAVYKEPALLILDEGTVNIDKRREKEISLNLAKLSATRIVVSHGNTFDDYANNKMKLIAGKITQDLHEKNHIGT